MRFHAQTALLKTPRFTDPRQSYKQDLTGSSPGYGSRFLIKATFFWPNKPDSVHPCCCQPIKPLPALRQRPGRVFRIFEAANNVLLFPPLSCYCTLLLKKKKCLLLGKMATGEPAARSREPFEVGGGQQPAVPSLYHYQAHSFGICDFPSLRRSLL